MERFENKTVWITGASSGIGQACAYQFALGQANLILTGTRVDALEKTAEKCKSLGANCKILPFDLSQTSEIPKLVNSAFECFGKIDILFNNAGISQRSLTAETSFDVDKKIMDINFFAPVLISKLVLPKMLENKGGTIAVTSSIAGKFGFPQRSAYSASKHALYGFFETVSAEYYNQKIRVVMVCPGFVNTNISMNALDGEGTRHGILDPGQAGGISAKSAAEKIVNGIYHKKSEILVGGKEMVMVYLKRFFPSVTRLLARNIKST